MIKRVAAALSASALVAAGLLAATSASASPVPGSPGVVHVYVGHPTATGCTPEFTWAPNYSGQPQYGTVAWVAGDECGLDIRALAKCQKLTTFENVHGDTWEEGTATSKATCPTGWFIDCLAGQEQTSAGVITDVWVWPTLGKCQVNRRE